MTPLISEAKTILEPVSYFLHLKVEEKFLTYDMADTLRCVEIMGSLKFRENLSAQDAGLHTIKGRGAHWSPSNESMKTTGADIMD